MSQIASLSQRKGGDHIPEQHQGCLKMVGMEYVWGRRESWPWPELTLGIRSEGSLGDYFWWEHFITTEGKLGHHLFHFLVEEEEFISSEQVCGETEHPVWISLLNIVRKEDAMPTYFLFLDNKEWTVSKTFRYWRMFNGLEPRTQVRNMPETAAQLLLYA